MSGEVTASWTQLMHQSEGTAKDYMSGAIEAIDEQFYKGYAMKNPDLIGKFMEVAARDFAATSESVKADKIERALVIIAEAIEEEQRLRRV